MKGYQQWCTVRSTVVSSHIREAVRNDRRLFTELSYHMDPDPAITEYFLQFNKERDNQEAQMELLGWKIFDYAGETSVIQLLWSSSCAFCRFFAATRGW
jgi:hypothetical protein